MKTESVENEIYLPDEHPRLYKTLLYAFQQILVMFPATITVALITGFPVSTTIFSCGLSTICFLLITKKQVPLFCGSSFAYMSAIIGLVSTQGFQTINGILPTEAIRISQFGIIMSGFVSVLSGLIVKFWGIKTIDRLLPPQVTGAVSIVIGLSLAGNALKDISPLNNDNQFTWVIAFVTFLVSVLIATYCKGFISQLPLLIGSIVGCVVALLVQLLGGNEFVLFRSIPNELFINSVYKISDGSIFALPSFSFPKVSLDAVVSIMPIALATIPESVAHVYQLDIYVNELAKKKDVVKRYKIKEKLAENLIGDGISDMICGLIGGPAGTSYGENMSTMLISKVFSVSVLFVTSVLLIILSCFAPLIKLIYCIPLSVIGGLEIYLFGAIAVQGIAILLQNKCDVFNTRNIAVISSILIIGIGGNYAFDGIIPVFGVPIPAISASAIFGIVLNLLLNFSKKTN